MARFDNSGGKRFGGGHRGAGFGAKRVAKPSFGRKSFDDRGDRGGRDFGRREVELYSATCDECQKNCQVPFRPSAGKPVYCSDCFGSKGGRSGERPQSYGGRDSSGPSSIDPNTKRQLEIINSKLDKLADAIETLSLRWER